MRPVIADKLKTLPTAPGVYLMKDDRGEIFYIGKAKSLRHRVRSYFSGSDDRAFVALLDELLADIEVVLTDNDKEAIILENDLIKKHRPRFNVKLVDDKNFLCLRLDVRQTYPRLRVVRRFAKDGARYFGPYHSAGSIRETLRLLNRHFQLRTCSDQVLRSRKRPCLQHQIKRCPAPCVYDLSGGEYRQNIDNVVSFLGGGETELVDRLRATMRELSEKLEYERAALIRDQIRAVDRSLERQRVVTSDFANRDVVGLYREGPAVEINVMRTRQGRLIDARRFSFHDLDLPTSEVLADFAVRYYAGGEEVPDEILFPAEMDWANALGIFLSERAGRAVRVLVPRRREKRRLVELASRNARQAFADKQREQGAARTSVERLQRALHLRRLPERIECFDISNLQAAQVVASAVRFEGGVARKDLYRRYKVRSVDGQDDFQAMYEVLSRRARRGLEEANLPDLILIDGGKGQLNAARAALEDHGIDEVEVVGLAKSRRDGASRGRRGNDRPSHSPERVFVLGQKNAIVLRKDSAELFMLTRARDEAHRFAIAYHRQLRRKAATKSQLDDIPGVGPKRRKALLRTFGSVARLKKAPADAIAAVVGPKLAAAITDALARRKV
ncbi:MAG: excinuclease ABC subunit UvrC [Myxococcota bacterium]